MPDDPLCAFCTAEHQGHYSIHRDGFGEGPEVPLCDACGSGEEPTCADIWEHISETGPKRKRRQPTPEERACHDYDTWKERRHEAMARRG